MDRVKVLKDVFALGTDIIPALRTAKYLKTLIASTSIIADELEIASLISDDAVQNLLDFRQLEEKFNQLLDCDSRDSDRDSDKDSDSPPYKDMDPDKVTDRDTEKHKHIPPWWPFKLRDSEHVDPVVLNLKKDGGSRALEASFANFDYDGDGFAEQTAWIGKNQGLLVIDRAMAGNTDDKTSRGSYIDARQLNVIEKFFGTKFNDGKNPNKWNGPLLADLYGNIKRYYEGWLSAQTTAAEYTSKISLALDDETGKLNLMETLHLTAPQAMDALKIPPTEQGRVSYTFCHK